MRRLIDLVETAFTAYYDPAAIWLHGGPAQLEGGHFRRGARGGRDMGGIFFVKDSREGWEHALGYAVARTANGGVWRCRITLPADKVLDWTNPAHRNRLKDAMAPESFERLAAYAGEGHMPWFRDPQMQQAFEKVLVALDFGGIVLLERQRGSILSVCVFDPAHIEIVDFTPKAEAMAGLRG